MTAEDILKRPHTGHPTYRVRGALELALRDAYAAGCIAAKTRSLYTAMEYAARNAPIIATMIADE